jgi:hypothetical protein
MSENYSQPFRVDITEDATTGIAIRLHNNGRFPDLLAEFPKDVLRKARPWMWTSYERRVLKKARSMSRQSHHLIRDMLVAERARVVESRMRRRASMKSRSWIESWKDRRAAKAQRASTREKVAAQLPRERTEKTLTLTELHRLSSGTALVQPTLDDHQQDLGRSR